uniref:Uncharacterized protein n=1 Tax=Globodera rostochiensis TaxID=31243 RepID=A0A914I6U3_GLORO
MPSEFVPGAKVPANPTTTALRDCFLLVVHILVNAKDGNAVSAPWSELSSAFCKHYVDLSLCQLRHQLAELGQLIDSATDEIDFLAAGTGLPSDAMPAQKRAKPTLADPVIAQLANLSSRSTRRFGPDNWLLGLRRAGPMFATNGRPSSGTLRLVPAEQTEPAQQQQKVGVLLRQLFKMT